MPNGYLDAIEKPGYHTVKMFRELSKGGIDFLWSAHNNWAVSMPNLTRFLGRGDLTGINDAFICVSEVVPDAVLPVRRRVLPAASGRARGRLRQRRAPHGRVREGRGRPGRGQVGSLDAHGSGQAVLAGEQIGGEDAFDHLFGAWYDAEAGAFKGTDARCARASGRSTAPSATRA